MEKIETRSQNFKNFKMSETFGTWNVRKLNVDGLPELLTDEQRQMEYHSWE